MLTNTWNDSPGFYKQHFKLPQIQNLIVLCYFLLSPGGNLIKKLKDCSYNGPDHVSSPTPHLGCILPWKHGRVVMLVLAKSAAFVLCTECVKILFLPFRSGNQDAWLTSSLMKKLKSLKSSPPQTPRKVLYCSSEMKHLFLWLMFSTKSAVFTQQLTGSEGSGLNISARQMC